MLSPPLYCCIFAQIGDLRVGKEWCGLALELEPNNVDALCDRAELFINNQMYEEAIKDYQTAMSVENHPQKVRLCEVSVRTTIAAFSQFRTFNVHRRPVIECPRC